tara:strand:- start:440 stop:673 length:234 start_codon:yes stop_codon:yes gene_type:complete
MSKSENQFVRFTRNARAENEDYSQGDIAAFSPKVCADLFSARAAELFNPPEKATRETADLPKPKAATALPAKRKNRR